MKQDAKYIRWFKEIKIGDIPSVGGKNASLGEMFRELASQGVKIPNGFAVTAEGLILTLFSTSDTPGAAQAAHWASALSPQERTLPLETL
jgi:phosphoenolpyruvate synthase/pyruvate phosphate dikinase